MGSGEDIALDVYADGGVDVDPASKLLLALLQPPQYREKLLQRWLVSETKDDIMYTTDDAICAWL